MSKEQKNKTKAQADIDRSSSQVVIPESTSKHAEDHPDFQEFVGIAKMTGTLTEEFSTLSMEDKKKFEVDFRQWVASGKPRPVMPELPKGVLEYPIVIWRGKDKGKEWFWYDTNLARKIGIVEKNGKIVSHEPEFEFSIPKMEKLLKEREQLCPIEQDRSCNLVIDGHNHLVQEDLITKPFDVIVKYLKTGQIA